MKLHFIRQAHQSHFVIFGTEPAFIILWVADTTRSMAA